MGQKPPSSWQDTTVTGLTCYVSQGDQQIKSSVNSLTDSSQKQVTRKRWQWVIFFLNPSTTFSHNVTQVSKFSGNKLNVPPDICSSLRHNFCGNHGSEFSSLHSRAGCHRLLQIRQHMDSMAKRNHHRDWGGWREYSKHLRVLKTTHATIIPKNNATNATDELRYHYGDSKEVRNRKKMGNRVGKYSSLLSKTQGDLFQTSSWNTLKIQSNPFPVINPWDSKLEATCSVPSLLNIQL